MSKPRVIFLVWLACLAFMFVKAQDGVSGSGESIVTIPIIVNGDTINYEIPENLLPFITQLAQHLAEAGQPTPVEIRLCEATPVQHDCDETTEQCVEFDNRLGHFECVCQEGYLRETSDGECVEDLCFAADPAVTCGMTEQCNNDEGNLGCKCAVGYHLNTNTSECEIITPCFPNPCPTTVSTCSDAGDGTYTCTCMTGYENANSMNDGTIQCDDITECKVSDNCAATAFCLDTGGSYTCTCNIGFTGDGLTCEDIIECGVSDNCAQYAFCEDTGGSFTCTCNMGFTGDGLTCEDIDDCALGVCDENASCDNSPLGSYTCTCNEGYTGKGKTCSDNDECTNGTHNCHDDATCSNSVGSFSCQCDTGYIGNGTSCTVDDECLLGLDNCDDNARCNNTVSGFDCTCSDRYLGDGIICADASMSFIVIAINVTGQSGRRKRSTPEENFAEAVENYLVEQAGDGHGIAVTALASSTANQYSVIIETTTDGILPFLKTSIQNAPGGSIGGVSVDNIATSTSVNISGIADTLNDPTDVCNSIVDHIQGKLPSSSGITGSGVPPDCSGSASGPGINFTVTLSDYYAAVNLSNILDDYTEYVLTLDNPSCAKNTCPVKADCTNINFAITCTCNDSSYDADITNPGQNCSSPIESVDCGADGITVKLYSSYFYRIGLQPDEIHMLDPSCTGDVSGGFLTFNNIGFETCGWQQTHTATAIEYSNKVTNIRNGVIVHPTSLSFNVLCTYSNKSETSTNEEDAASVNVIQSEPTLIDSIEGEGSLRAILAIFSDGAFTIPLTTDDDPLGIKDSVFVTVSHSASSTDYIKLIDCWITPTNDSTDGRRNIITESCPDTAYTTVNIISNGNGFDARFEFPIVGLVGEDGKSVENIYMHCTAEASNSPFSITCGASGRRRRRHAEDSRNVLSAGPIKVVNTGGAVASTNAGAVVGGCIAAIVVIACVGFFGYRFYKKRQYAGTSTPVHRHVTYDNFFPTQDGETGQYLRDKRYATAKLNGR